MTHPHRGCTTDDASSPDCHPLCPLWCFPALLMLSSRESEPQWPSLAQGEPPFRGLPNIAVCKTPQLRSFVEWPVRLPLSLAGILVCVAWFLKIQSMLVRGCSGTDLKAARRRSRLSSCELTDVAVSRSDPSAVATAGFPASNRW